MPRRVVLISDLQQGARLAALGEFAWPSDVELELKTVDSNGSNAGLSALADSAEVEPSDKEAERTGPRLKRCELSARVVRTHLDRRQRNWRPANRSRSTFHQARAEWFECLVPRVRRF